MKNWFLVLGLLLIIGCKDQYKECNKTPPKLYTAGYDSTSRDSIIIFRYEKGSNFSKMLSESLLVFSESATSMVGKDSFFINVFRFEPYTEQYDNFDWRYTILKTGDKFDITESKRKINKTSIDHPNSACTSPIISLKVNGRFVEFKEDFQSLWLTKP